MSVFQCSCGFLSSVMITRMYRLVHVHCMAFALLCSNDRRGSLAKQEHDYAYNNDQVKCETWIDSLGNCRLLFPFVWSLLRKRRLLSLSLFSVLSEVIIMISCVYLFEHHMLQDSFDWNSALLYWLPHTQKEGLLTQRDSVRCVTFSFWSHLLRRWETKGYITLMQPFLQEKWHENCKSVCLFIFLYWNFVSVQTLARTFFLQVSRRRLTFSFTSPPTITVLNHAVQSSTYEGSTFHSQAPFLRCFSRHYWSMMK